MYSDVKIVANKSLKQNVLQFETISMNSIYGKSSNQPDAMAYNA